MKLTSLWFFFPAMGGSERQRAAPGRAGKIGVALEIGQVLPNFRHFMIWQPCRFRAQQPTLYPTNLVSNTLSWASRTIRHHEHIMKNKLTGGYRKRLSGSRAINENVKSFPEFLVVTGAASTPRLKKRVAWTVRQNRLYKPHTCHKGAASASEQPPARPEKLA